MKRFFSTFLILFICVGLSLSQNVESSPSRLSKELLSSKLEMHNKVQKRLVIIGQVNGGVTGGKCGDKNCKDVLG
jgi:hypothetical protein